MQCDARQCRVPRAPQLSNRATVQGGNMNGLLAARRICREKVNILIQLYAEALPIRTCTSLVLASPQASRREETSPNPWFLARIMLPFPTAQRRYVNQGPFRTRRTPNRPLLPEVIS